MKIGGIINQQQGLLGFGAWGRCVGRFFCGLLGCSLFRLGSQVNTTLLADNLIMSVNVRNQFSGGLVDGLQTGPQLRQRLVLAPGGDIAEAVFAGLDAIILTDGVGDALGLHLLGVAVLDSLFHRRQIFLHLQPPLKLIFVHIAPVILGGGLFRLCFGGEVQAIIVLDTAPTHHHDFPGRLRLILFGVVQLAVGDLMDGGGNGLHLAHACPDGDALLVRREIPVHVGGHRLHGERHRRGPAS